MSARVVLITHFFVLKSSTRRLAAWLRCVDHPFFCSKIDLLDLLAVEGVVLITHFFVLKSHHAQRMNPA